MKDKLSLLLLITLACVCVTEANFNLFSKNTCTSLWAYPFFYIDPRCSNNPDVHRTAATLLTRNDYQYEVHTVTTPDGFILRLFRIPGDGQPVFLQHKIGMNGNVWIDKGDRSLAFQLADKGYDVWIGTVRTSTLGRSHRTLTMNDQAYWNFTLDTIAAQDIPLALEVVANETGKAGEIIYVGHSTGCSLMLMFAASQPDKAAELVKGIVGLAPVAYTDGGRLVDLLKPFTKLLRTLSQLLGKKGVNEQERMTMKFNNIACRFVPHLCILPMWFIYGKDPKQFSPEDLLLYYSSTPVMTGVDEHIQLLQIGQSKKFQKFDYGSSDNQKQYGSSKPPKYDLKKIKLPVYQFYGKNDKYAVPKNIKRVHDELGSSSKKMIEISTNGSIPFNHIDFVYPKDANTLLYPQIFKVLEEDLAS